MHILTVFLVFYDKTLHNFWKFIAITTASEEIEEEDDIFSEFLTNPTAVAAAAAIAGPLALAAVVPPPLPMFPPQGLPQPNAGSVPGAGGGGGGSLPSTALTVCGLCFLK